MDYGSPIFAVVDSITSSTVTSRAGSILESDERLICTDLICEGPIEGLSDKDGELLKYITDETKTQVDNLVLGKGVYYQNVPLIDSKLNKLNFVTAGFNISYGEEFNVYKNQYASTIHNYNQKLYLNETDIYYKNIFGGDLNSAGFFAFYQDEDSNCYEDILQISPNALPTKIKSQKFLTSNGVFNFPILVQLLDQAKKNCQEFNHKIVNKYADQISVHIRADQMFATSSNGSTVINDGAFVVEISESNSSKRYFVIVKMSGISKGGYTVDIPINLNLNSVTYNNYYVKVYALTTKIPPDNGNNFKQFTLAAIIERVKTRGVFCYPFSAIVKSAVSSRHFNQDPERTFDLKLLKIKIPSNYDPETREYNGNWNGKFSSFLKWTDNPAWIFYDICTNSRYGIGNGLILDKDLNKWELYKIGKYCDELITVSTPHKYTPDNFYIDINDKNIIYIDKMGRDINTFKKQYPPVFDIDKIFTASNNGYNNSIIFLYDLQNDNEKFETAYKKIIWSIEDNGSNYKIKLINDFGPKWFFENDNTGLLQKFSDDNILLLKDVGNKKLSDRITLGSKNSQAGAKNYILQSFANSVSTYSEYINAQIFLDDMYYDGGDLNSIGLYGKCLPRVYNFRDPFEPRFSCNTLIDNETEALKIINDLASIFRGITYYKNNFVTATVDVNKPVSYLFNNSNVKNGLFSYSTGSLDGTYTVAKVLYKDKYENFTEQVEIVEDYALIRKYGIVVKEILGFGITSKNQARRIGQWMLLTNRFENQTVTFSTDLQGIVLRPSDVIQIEDQYRNDNLLQGRVVDVDYNNRFIVVDRQLDLNLIGQKIKFIYDKKSKTISDLNSSTSVSDADIDSLDVNNVIELQIQRIENNTNRVYFDTDYNYSLFNSILKTTPFIIQDNNSNQVYNLYKIISISEAENNEYTLFCIKHDPAKYEALTNNTYQFTTDFTKNTIVYATTDIVKELTFSSYNYYNTAQYTLSQLGDLVVDYTFNEPKSSLVASSDLSKEYWVCNLQIVNLFNYIQTQSSSSTYYKQIQNVLDDNGGLLFKVSLRNQNVKFVIKNNTISNKSVFLGKFGGSPVFLSGSAQVKVYLFDKNNKIINV